MACVQTARAKSQRISFSLPHSAIYSPGTKLPLHEDKQASVLLVLLYTFTARSSLCMMMLIKALLVSALASLCATVNAAVINHDAVVPFVEPVPTTLSHTVALKFKPQIHISNGCHPYPAGDAAGNTGGGLKLTGLSDGNCKGSGWGTQVYGRTAAYKDVYALMYSWYFPKNSAFTGLSHRHDWEHVVMWLDNPALANPTILAVTPSAHSGYRKYAPPKAGTVDSNSAKVDYTSVFVINHALDSTTSGGEKQPLIMWDQMTDAACAALEHTDFGDGNVPMKDSNFMTKVTNAREESVCL